MSVSVWERALAKGFAANLLHALLTSQYSELYVVLGNPEPTLKEKLIFQAQLLKQRLQPCSEVKASAMAAPYGTYFVDVPLLADVSRLMFVCLLVLWLS
jgi:hypothetical protein